MKRAAFVLLPACALLAACGSQDSGAEAGGMTPVEARALEDAAEMLDQQRLPADLASPPAVTPQEREKPSAQ